MCVILMIYVTEECLKFSCNHLIISSNSQNLHMQSYRRRVVCRPIMDSFVIIQTLNKTSLRSCHFYILKENGVQSQVKWCEEFTSCTLIESILPRLLDSFSWGELFDQL